MRTQNYDQGCTRDSLLVGQRVRYASPWGVRHGWSGVRVGIFIHTAPSLLLRSHVLSMDVTPHTSPLLHTSVLAVFHTPPPPSHPIPYRLALTLVDVHGRGGRSAHPDGGGGAPSLHAYDAERHV